jgi:pyruvate formate lyase activating enzyme
MESKNGFHLTKLKEANFYVRAKSKIKTGKNNEIICLLCPHRCRIPEGKRGICRGRKNISGKMYCLAYSNLCAIAIDPIEKKPMFHFIPNSKTLSIAIAGCNLRCLNCQNFEISQANPKESAIIKLLPEEVIKIAINKNVKIISYTYTEPTIFFEYMFDTAKIAKQNKMKNIMVSNGYINPMPLKKLCTVLDGANIDLKCFDEKNMQTLTGGRLLPVLESLKTIKSKGVFLEITNLIIPKYCDDPKIIKDMCTWIVKNLGCDTPIHFSAFYPTYKLSYLPNTPLSSLIQAKKVALETGLKFVYIGNANISESENTHCPNCKKLLIERKNFKVYKNNLNNSKCIFCGEKIPGIWNL